jgi:hypothetical protein
VFALNAQHIAVDAEYGVAGAQVEALRIVTQLENINLLM